ncbi:MAG: hypothetical protein A3J07_03245 [Candidatus Doudnabacteria bacterium RIFCSPLOWO2_02_FULL_49_13]|uniref:Non-canonical purine NTP pyrophosphatase n=1 Tax=Candidatus Doudnabacteria bacterium RIFCSPHIGHO2_12_FULL_48_16 TaxID=1817838 RepID=A0A1F5PIP9_9BACT|nr:MAG: hypothetical protein A3B77_02050 [Candidatus Doudnabacteria bacterium RIFCSPHIGHO2_02_FULL_49_24]OGE89372.1 MAG: hypothetical protein A2760_03300 [Candidatus Doudnabacteria bacterium RIFCSPHIGHO2_01_FULL_50_67]OGE89684.1 MAG: hypothetical protein A3E29_00505 [Candidatus Doudnabacteria bacterium RIFCSPHIGHO2_12_FULL_48_16]OGE97518.1 MAG: hypothetical protein A2990_02245 [Candidatus Doudnabacteria bacterium RIFCSPLOWO2_01_FULL_49_40]OGF03078.1 MAG: hypothetical protein A3J07_03245 [Candid
MNKILIGTGNPGKVKIYKELLKGFNLEVVSSKDLNLPEPEETGKTFEQTAVDKAKYYFEKSGIPAIVDDGGFEIEALNGEPGVKSRRWIGREMTEEEIVAEVFKRMKNVPNRACKHVVILALATPFGVFTAHGEVAGVVPEKPSDKRETGLTFRPVMFLPNYNKYWIDLTDEEEDVMNHRKVAVEKLHDILKELAG